MSRASQAKEFPLTPEKAIPELFERQAINMNDLPDEIKKHYIKNLQQQLNKKYNPM